MTMQAVQMMPLTPIVDPVQHQQPVQLRRFQRFGERKIRNRLFRLCDERNLDC